MLCFQPIVTNRLAALHRGTLRALRVITHQLSDHGKVPSYHRELVQLIQLLSICSAQVKEDGSPALSDSALQVLHKLQVRVRTKIFISAQNCICLVLRIMRAFPLLCCFDFFFVLTGFEFCHW